MRFAGFVLLLAALLCGSLYLFVHNGHSVELRLADDWLIQAPLAAQLTSAFLVGTIGMFAAIALRDSGRALVRWRRRRGEQRTEKMSGLLAEGRRLLWRGEPERARAILQRAWKARQTRDVLTTLVQASLEADNAGDARRALDSAHEPLADDPEVLCLMADVCRQIGDTSGAIAALERARARHPRAGRVLLSLRDLYLATERWHEAAAVQTAWLALHPRVSSPIEHTLLSGTRYEAAMHVPGPATRLQALEQVLAQNPRFLPAAVSLGDELMTAGRADEAIRRWETTLRLQPHAILIERLRSNATDRSARDRLRNLLRKLRFDELDADAVHYYVAQLWLDDGQAASAAAEIGSMSKRFAATAAHHVVRARLEEYEAHFERAAADYRASIGALIPWTCNVCQRADSSWHARCPRCHRWDTARAAVELVRES